MVGSLFIGNITATPVLYRYSGLSNVLLGSIVFTDTINNIGGFDIFSGNLIILDSTNDYIYNFSGISSTSTGSFSTPNIYGKDIVVVNGSLYTTSSDGGTTSLLYKHSGMSSVINGSFEMIGPNTHNIVFYGGSLYSSRYINDTSKIGYLYSDFNGTVGGSIKITESIDSNVPTPCISFDNNGNLLVLGDGDTTSAENWIVFQYSGFSTTLIGSIVFGQDAQPFRGMRYYEVSSGTQPTTISQSDSCTVSDSLTKSLKLSKSLSDSSTLDDSVSIAGISSTYEILVTEPAIELSDGEAITKKIRVSKSYTESIHISDSFSHSIRTPLQITYVRINVT